MARPSDGVAHLLFRGLGMPLGSSRRRPYLLGSESRRFSGHSIVASAVAAGSAGSLRCGNTVETGWHPQEIDRFRDPFPNLIFSSLVSKPLSRTLKANFSLDRPNP